MAEASVVGPGRILATGQVMDGGKHMMLSKGSNFDYPTGRLSFPNIERDRFVVMLTDVTKNTYNTSTTIAVDWEIEWVTLRNKALDTGNRLMSADNFNFTIVTVD